jgi:hypothetical protein
MALALRMTLAVLLTTVASCQEPLLNQEVVSGQPLPSTLAAVRGNQGFVMLYLRLEDCLDCTAPGSLVRMMLRQLPSETPVRVLVRQGPELESVRRHLQREQLLRGYS